jgi:hypothetical protein
MHRRLMTLTACAGLALLLGLELGVAPVAAEPQADVGARPVATDWSAQRRTRARPQIRVQPRYPYRRFHSLYPPPYDYEYPGPNGVRQCVDGYATEYRASGPVVVPRMRCWWVRG